MVAANMLSVEVIFAVLTFFAAILMAVIAAILPLAILWSAALDRVSVLYPAPSGSCAACGYSLDGLPTESCCPECGSVSEARDAKIRVEVRWRAFGPLLLLIALSPVIWVPLAAVRGLAIGYERAGIETGLALQYASDDPSPGMPLTLAVCSALATVTALTRGRGIRMQLATLVVTGAAIFALLVVAYSLDVHRRGLDITWGLYGFLPVVEGMLTLGPIAALLREIQMNPQGARCILPVSVEQRSPSVHPDSHKMPP